MQLRLSPRLGDKPSFLKRIDAPEKQWILFENSAHTPSLEEPDKFRKIIMKETNRD